MRYQLTYMAAVALVICMTGCASFGTNFLHRTEDNSAWQNEKHLRGVPVTLKVPTHVRIDVIEKSYLLRNAKSVQRKNPAFPLRTVQYTPIETEKIFLVDLKRPGAGTIGATLKFDAQEQYFNSIKTDVTDETLSAISALVAQVAPGGLIGSPTNETGTPTAFQQRIKELNSVVASNVFEFDAPDFEQQVTAFLSEHLNCCHDCGVKKSLNPDPVGNVPIPMLKTEAAPDASGDGDEPVVTVPATIPARLVQPVKSSTIRSNSPSADFVVPDYYEK